MRGVDAALESPLPGALLEPCEPFRREQRTRLWFPWRDDNIAGRRRRNSLSRAIANLFAEETRGRELGIDRERRVDLNQRGCAVASLQRRAGRLEMRLQSLPAIAVHARSSCKRDSYFLGRYFFSIPATTT